MSVRRSMMWSLLGNWVNFASNLLATMVLGRLLTPVQFGVFTVAMATLLVIQAVLQVGTGSVVMREAEIDDTMLGSALGVALLEGLAIGLVAAVASAFVGDWQRSSEVGRMLLLLAPVPLFNAVEIILTSIWCRNLQFGRSAALVSIKSALQAVVSVGFALAGLGPASLAAGTLAGAALGLIVGIAGLRRLGIGPNLQHFRYFAIFGGKWMLLGGLRALNIRIPELMLGRLVSLASAGLYNRAAASLDMVVRNGVDPIARVMLPVLVQDRRRGAGLADGVIKLSTNLTAIFWPIYGFIALEASSLVVIIFGSQWTAAAPVLSFLCLWAALLLPAAGSVEVMLICDRTDLSLRIEALRTVVGIVFVVAAAPAGLVAIAAVRVLEPLVVLPIQLVFFRRLADLSLRGWAIGHGRSLVIAIVTLAPVAATRGVLPPHGPVIVDVAIKGAVAAVCYCAALFMLRHPLAEEGLGMVRRRLGVGA